MEKQKNIPQLRFTEFEGEWNHLILGDVCEKIQDGNYGGDYPKSTEFVDNGIPFLTSKAIGQDGILIDDKIDYITEEKHSQLKKAHLKLHDILFTNRGASVGAIGIVTEKVANGNIGPQLTLLRCSNKIHCFFLKTIMVSPLVQKQIQSQNSGSAMNFFGIGDTSKFKLNIPTLPEQQKIASFFTAIDQKISQLKHKKTLMEQYKKGVMQKIFSQEIRFKKDDGQEFPKWEKKKLGDISDRITTKNGEGNETVLTISAQHGLVSQLDFFNKSVAADDLSGYYLLKKDDFAYNKSYSTGYPMGAFKRLKLYDKGVVSSLYICFTFNSSANLSFMEQYFESGRHNREIEKVAQEGARNHGLLNVGVGDFFSTEVLLPFLEEQTKIANFLSAIDDKINHTQKQIEKAEVWKKGLMQQMFV